MWLLPGRFDSEIPRKFNVNRFVRICAMSAGSVPISPACSLTFKKFLMLPNPSPKLLSQADCSITLWIHLCISDNTITQHGNVTSNVMSGDWPIAYDCPLRPGRGCPISFFILPSLFPYIASLRYLHPCPHHSFSFLTSDVRICEGEIWCSSMCILRIRTSSASIYRYGNLQVLPWYSAEVALQNEACICSGLAPPL